MAAIDTLLDQIEDEKLRKRLRAEVDALLENKEFGLVFQDHLPELVPMYSEKVRKGSTVAIRGEALTNMWDVRKVVGKAAVCINKKTKEERHIPTEQLVVVLQFGEPIFPSLAPVDKVQNGPNDAPWHTLIEADNYHALQLLEYLYAGQVDCIYIDPPYNTGARDWKYNNDYVDGNDAWRHSKWLAFVSRRLKIAKKLLKPDSGVLIVTIDEHEVHHLGLLLEQEFPSSYRQMVTIVITARGVAKQGLARVEEHAHFVYLGNGAAVATDDDFLNSESSSKAKSPWASLLRRGTNAAPFNRPGLVYPIKLDPSTKEIIGVGETVEAKISRGDFTRQQANSFNPPRTEAEAWPIRSDGSLGTWQVKPGKLLDLRKSGFVKIGRFDSDRKSWSVNYLKRGPISEIERGELVVVGREWDDGPVILEYVDDSNAPKRAKTVWHRTLHDAGTYGSGIIRQILGNRAFEFPKSIYSVRDTLSTIVGINKDALVIDFFAGSGTTLNAVNLLNATDGGQRRCIMVTNNEVASDEAARLSNEDKTPGDEEWEKHGICQSVTWPRTKYTVLGSNQNGTLPGEYFTGKFQEKEKPRSYYDLSFVSADSLNSVKKKKLLVSVIGKANLPQSLVKKDSKYIVSEDYPASVLFDESEADAWLDALEDQDHITSFYIVAANHANFGQIKARVEELLGSSIVMEEVMRPLSDGFAANVEYFRLDFLDKNNVALGRQFREILPLLWLRAGAIGPRPELPRKMDIPAMMIPETNPFAVLIDEAKYSDFLTRIEKRRDLTHVFLITDSEDAFHEMAENIAAPNVVQLYRDYLENFMINKGDKE